ncbi:MAG: phage integrase N-terminal SAM-like domain-containing protein, partial [Candidatus Krumholzibacteria bacterium]|nr:phage integrase N-terminal SAM-like domain-containing protein [Candidatus Krumholzibacteria bacterium]
MERSKPKPTDGVGRSLASMMPQAGLKAVEGQHPPRLLDQLQHALRCRHYSRKTEDAYRSWIKRYVYFHKLKHPAEMGE